MQTDQLKYQHLRKKLFVIVNKPCTCYHIRRLISNALVIRLTTRNDITTLVFHLEFRNKYDNDFALFYILSSICDFW